MKNEQVFVLCRWPDDSIVIMGFLTVGRSDKLPFGATWIGSTGWWDRPPTKENIEREIIDEYVSTGRWASMPLSYEIVDPATLPSDPRTAMSNPDLHVQRRRYREAWKSTDGRSVTVDMTIAKEIHKKVLRRLRQPLLDEQDRLYNRAQGKLFVLQYTKSPSKEDVDAVEAEMMSIETERQRLRDVTKDPRIDEAKSVDDLIKIMP